MNERPSPRAAIAAMPRYVPGARGQGGAQPYKISSNENPYDPLPSVADVVAEAGHSINRYPDMFSVEITERLAQHVGVPQQQVAVGAGSVAVLGHILQAFCEPASKVGFAWRSFEAYPILTQLVGAQPVMIPLAEGARHDLSAMAAAVTDDTAVVLLCSPNNPTGPVIMQDEFDAFMAAVPRTVLVVLDEAYGEFVREPSVVDGRAALDAHPNLMLLRTFSKAYGLAGLRVGYAVGHDDAIAAVRACTTPFSVSGVAQVAAVASLDAEPELLERVAALVEERTRVLAAVRELGWEVPASEGNFFWLPAGDAALDLAAHLGAAEPPVLVRPFAGDGVRVSIGAPHENDHMVATLAGFSR